MDYRDTMIKVREGGGGRHTVTVKMEDEMSTKGEKP